MATHCVANLGWTHLRLIMRLDDEKERHYYLQEASSQNWSSRVLERNIKSGYYRRLLSSQNKAVEKSEDASSFIKDPYVLEFLDVPDDLTGKESFLESSIIGKYATCYENALDELNKHITYLKQWLPK